MLTNSIARKISPNLKPHRKALICMNHFEDLLADAIATLHVLQATFPGLTSNEAEIIHDRFSQHFQPIDLVKELYFVVLRELEAATEILNKSTSFLKISRKSTLTDPITRKILRNLKPHRKALICMNHFEDLLADAIATLQAFHSTFPDLTPNEAEIIHDRFAKNIQPTNRLIEAHPVALRKLCQQGSFDDAEIFPKEIDALLRAMAREGVPVSFA